VTTREPGRPEPEQRHCGHRAGGPGARRARGDRGSATVWAAIAVTVLCTVFATVLAMGQVVATRYRAAAAADLAALAAADLALRGQGTACARAVEVAGAQGASLVHCAVRGELAEVTAETRFGPYRPSVRARAGPGATPVAAPEPSGPGAGARPELRSGRAGLSPQGRGVRPAPARMRGDRTVRDAVTADGRPVQEAAAAPHRAGTVAGGGHPVRPASSTARGLQQRSGRSGRCDPAGRSGLVHRLAAVAPRGRSGAGVTGPVEAGRAVREGVAHSSRQPIRRAPVIRAAPGDRVGRRTPFVRSEPDGGSSTRPPEHHPGGGGLLPAAVPGAPPRGPVSTRAGRGPDRAGAVRPVAPSGGLPRTGRLPAGPAVQGPPPVAVPLPRSRPDGSRPVTAGNRAGRPYTRTGQSSGRPLGRPGAV
jgi:secretion/DNA translocation related TadE-like protein